jgi:hypothetical protein
MPAFLNSLISMIVNGGVAICVFDAAGNMIETHEHKGEFKEP